MDDVIRLDIIRPNEIRTRLQELLDEKTEIEQHKRTNTINEYEYNERNIAIIKEYTQLKKELDYILKKQRETFEKTAKEGGKICITDLMISHGM